MRPSQVLVCGTNYGGSYVKALAGAGDRYVLAGLLARGGERSKRSAETLKVPLYTSVSEVPDRVDLACAAMGSEAHPVVLELLGRGMPVLCEHPLTERQVRVSLETATSSGSRFHVNGHWSELDSSRVFAEKASSDAPIHLQMTVADRFLYGALDILRRAVPDLTPTRLDRVTNQGPYVLLAGTLGSLPVTIQVQSSRRRDGSEIEEASFEYLVCYRMILEFSDGALALLGPGGPVIWNANESRVADLKTPLARILYEGSENKLELSRQRQAANLRSIDALAAGGSPPEQHSDYLLNVSGTWETIGRVLAD